MTRFKPLVILLVLIWGIEAINILFGHGLAVWGILPRHMMGLVGM